jgi:hypothetical protein
MRWKKEGVKNKAEIGQRELSCCGDKTRDVLVEKRNQL